MNHLKICAWASIGLMILSVSCTEKGSQQASDDYANDTLIEVETFESGGLDLKHFDEAMEAYDEKEFAEAAEHLRMAAIALLEDSTEDSNTDHISKAVAMIDSLANAVEEGKVSSKLALAESFSDAELIISHHYFKLTETVTYEELSKWEVQMLDEALAYLKGGLIHGSYDQKAAGLDLIQKTRKLIGDIQNGEPVDLVLVKNQVQQIKNFVADL